MPGYQRCAHCDAHSGDLSTWHLLQAFGTARAHRKIGSRNPDAVVVPRVDRHVGGRRHVTGDATAAGRTQLVEGVGRCLVLRRCMALKAHPVARRAQLERMRVVAVAAGHALLVHQALLERGVVVDLRLHLAVGPEQGLVQQRRHMRVEQRLAMHIVVGDLAAMRMAARAQLDFGAVGRRRRAAHRVAAFRADGPVRILAIAQQLRQAHRCIRQPGRPGQGRPGHVARSRPMAAFAADVAFGPGAAVGARDDIEFLLEVGRMAFGAHEVPVVLAARPVQRVAGLDVLPGMQVEPALAALVERARVPGHGQSLHAFVGHRDQELLQRIDAQGVSHLEFLFASVATLSLDVELAVALPEPRGDAGLREGLSMEGCQHARGRGVLHRQIMVRTLPGLKFDLVAGGTGLGPDEPGDRRRRVSARGDGVRRALQAEGAATRARAERTLTASAIATSFRCWMRMAASRWKHDGEGSAPARQLHGVGATCARRRRRPRSTRPAAALRPQGCPPSAEPTPASCSSAAVRAGCSRAAA